MKGSRLCWMEVIWLIQNTKESWVSVIGTGPVPREEQTRGWRTQRKTVEKGWTGTLRKAVVSHLRAEAHETGLRWDSEQACVCRERYGAGHCRVMIMGKKQETGDSESGFFSGTWEMAHGWAGRYTKLLTSRSMWHEGSLQNISDYLHCSPSDMSPVGAARWMIKVGSRFCC